VTRDEWRAIQAYLETLSETESTNLKRIQAQSKEEDLGEGVFVPLCTFLDMETRHCSIYPVRPLVCRLLGHTEWLPCPIEKVPRVVDTGLALELMRAYAEEERFTLDSPPDGV
jgi:Fe-S-cluster containining protein